MMTLNEIETAINELEKKIEVQRETNIKLYNSIPSPTREDPRNERAEPILKQWRAGSKKIKELLAEQNKLRDARREATAISTDKQHSTFVNGFGEATTREITCATYKKAQKRLDKEILSFMGRR